MPDEYLYAEDVARKRGVSVRQGERILATLERRHGSDVVGRLGAGEQRPRRFTTTAALEKIMPQTRGRLSDLHERLAHLEDMVRAGDRRVDALEIRVSNVEKNA